MKSKLTYLQDGLVVHFSPRTLRAMYDDFDKIMRSDNYDNDFKRFIQNIMDEISERHVKLTKVDIKTYTLIHNLYIKVLATAQARGLETHNVSIYVHSKFALPMPVGKSITIEYLPVIRNVPVVQSDLVNQSDIFIYSPDWPTIVEIDDWIV